jgi:23S rRNA pseudouridine2605 synthase
MRINKYIAQLTQYSRRQADNLIADNRVKINDRIAKAGDSVETSDTVFIDGAVIASQTRQDQIFLLHKPTGYVCSRNGQGSPTIYSLLPPNLQHLNYVGRLDKDSSGLLVLANDGLLIESLTHPRYQKEKIYHVTIDKPLRSIDKDSVQRGIMLEDGLSKLSLKGSRQNWKISMHEGKNRQIRRTFEHLGYRVVKLHRTNFGPYNLNDLKEGNFILVQ